MTLTEAIQIAKRECKNEAAQTYLAAIPLAIDEGAEQGSAMEGLRVQMLYVLSNMTGWRGKTAQEVKKVIRAFVQKRTLNLRK